MASLDTHKHADYRLRRRAESREYWLIFCLLYPQLLVAAIVSRLVSVLDLRHPRPSEPRRSVFAEARIAAASCIPFAFK